MSHACTHDYAPPTKEQLVRLFRIVVTAQSDDPEQLADVMLHVNAMCGVCRDRTLDTHETNILEAVMLMKSGMSPDEANRIVNERMAGDDRPRD